MIRMINERLVYQRVSRWIEVMVGIGIEVACLLSRLPALFPYEPAEESSELMSLLGNIWVIQERDAFFLLG